MEASDLKTRLDALVEHFERSDFIVDDPIAIPHGFDNPRDQEVIGLLSALLAWGRRRTVLNKMAELCERMRFQPYEYVVNFDAARDTERLKGFKHRTFQPEDALWLVHNLSLLLRRHETVENLFTRHMQDGDRDIRRAIQGFSDSLLRAHPETPRRLQKHLARPDTGSACKRLNMFLRWMVRPGPVDLGIWTGFDRRRLMLPLDVHSGRQARRFGLITRATDDWSACVELTEHCRLLSPDDPARYDFAFFGVGVYGPPAS